jgi:hypothetical protein
MQTAFARQPSRIGPAGPARRRGLQPGEGSFDVKLEFAKSLRAIFDGFGQHFDGVGLGDVRARAALRLAARRSSGAAAACRGRRKHRGRVPRGAQEAATDEERWEGA